jgi:2-C-methyl-D-erythritol 2,4-cyclodiphosphate synthase
VEDYRVGLGIDIHRFTNKKKDLTLGGFKIPSPFGVKAVSDGDVLLHAVSDALCGACLLGDIGDYFPPSAKKSKGIDSKEIVQHILKEINGRFKIVNIDVTVVAEKPPLCGYKKDIVKSLQNIFNLVGINLKLKSKEELDILGGKNAIACFAVVLVKDYGK